MEYLEKSEKLKRILTGKPFWFYMITMDSNGFHIAKPRETKHERDENQIRNALCEKHGYQITILGKSLEFACIFDNEKECRAGFVADALKARNNLIKMMQADIDKPTVHYQHNFDRIDNEVIRSLQ